MRRLLESLTPDDRQIYWRWVGGMFALYVVLMLTAAGVFVSHESSRKLAQQPATTVAIERSRVRCPGLDADAAGRARLSRLPAFRRRSHCAPPRRDRRRR